MQKAMITADGLSIMARIFISCRPIMGGILTANQIYLISHVRAGESINFNSFKKGLPVVDPTYDQIFEYAKKLGKKDIDAEAVQKFFGGEPHFDKILGQIEEFKLKKDFAQKILFAHILIPVEITSVSGTIAGIYKNADAEVKIKNLVLSSKKMDVKKGDNALVHYASVITVDFSDAVREYLLKVQAQKKEFIQACGYVEESGGINYNNFWNLCEWTKKKSEKCDL